MACTIHRVLVFGSGDDDRDYVASLGCTISNGAITVLHTQRRSCAVFTSRLRPFIESYPMPPPPPHTATLGNQKKVETADFLLARGPFAVLDDPAEGAEVRTDRNDMLG